MSRVPVHVTEGGAVDGLDWVAALQHAALHLLDPLLRLRRVPRLARRPQPLRHGRGARPHARREVDAVDELVPHARLAPDHELLLRVRAVEVERLGEVVLGPVAAVADVVEVPGAAEDGPQPAPRHLRHLPLPLALAHIS